LEIKKNKPDSAVGIVTRLWSGQLRIYGSIPGRIKRFLSSPKCPDQFWNPSNLQISRSQMLFPWSMKLTTSI